MRIHIAGSKVPEKILGALAEATNHATLLHRQVTFDGSAGVVSMPLLRFPVRKRRPLLGDVSDVARPIRTVVTVRNVVACDIDDFTDDDLDGRVELLFGVTVEGATVFASSAEESRGTTCYQISMTVSELDIEVADIDGDRDSDGV